MKPSLSMMLFVYLFAFSSAHAKEYQKFVHEVDGRQRIYYLHVPDKLAKQAPLVFMLHGYGGSAESTLNWSGMNTLADSCGFAVCYPQGNLGSDNKNSWNAGYSNDDVDDVKFLSELAGFLQREYGFSVDNTFVCGMSNGADMCYVMACSAPQVFSAIAPVAGCMMQRTFENCKPQMTVPVFETHGIDDELTLWMGDSTYSEKYGAYLGTRTVVDFWVKNNACTEGSKWVIADSYKGDKSYIVAEKYTGKTKRQQVCLYSIVGGKHDYPGVWGNMDVHMAQEIWNFFKQFIISD